jgi:hypothetical protein
MGHHHLKSQISIRVINRSVYQSRSDVTVLGFQSRPQGDDHAVGQRTAAPPHGRIDRKTTLIAEPLSRACFSSLFSSGE